MVRRDERRCYVAHKNAEEAITAKYDRPGSITGLRGWPAVETVSFAVNDERDGRAFMFRPAPAGEDCLNAITLLDDARRTVGYHELNLIEAAIDKGVSLQQIGMALGHTEVTAERAARARRAQLRRQFPSWDWKPPKPDGAA